MGFVSRVWGRDFVSSTVRHGFRIVVSHNRLAVVVGSLLPHDFYKHIRNSCYHVRA